jgi:hypothetical protein
MPFEIATWDWWRDRYDTLGFREMRVFYELVGVEYPPQRGANTDAVVAFCETLPDSAIVQELGGNDGFLAAEVLARNSNIKWWVNREIWPDANKKKFCQDLRYVVELLDTWPERYAWDGDAFIATHVIEHMTADHIEMLISSLTAKHVLIEAPLGEGHRTDVTWAGYDGSHILEWEWGPVEECFRRHGYAVELRDGWVRTFKRFR